MHALLWKATVKSTGKSSIMAPGLCPPRAKKVQGIPSGSRFLREDRGLGLETDLIGLCHDAHQVLGGAGARGRISGGHDGDSTKNMIASEMITAAFTLLFGLTTPVFAAAPAKGYVVKAEGAQI